MVRVAEAQSDSSDIVMVSRSPEMQRVMQLTKTTAKGDSAVLITGESGTGKERIARFVHEHSARVNGPFIAINCATISGSVLESELFGYCRGAFRGAIADRPGLFEAAGRGTLFLDGLGGIPLPLQVKILRAFEEREVRRVGETQSRPINVRIITATNKNLLPEVAAKRFPKDLYYRLKGVKLALPPLRERKEDVLPLARILLAEASVWMKRPVEGFTGPVADHLLDYAWPGNVRELANVMERAVAVAMTNRVNMEDLPLELRS
jgi:transcriptional regulator with PAS, ATPase and Fis domain